MINSYVMINGLVKPVEIKSIEVWGDFYLRVAVKVLKERGYKIIKILKRPTKLGFDRRLIYYSKK